MACLRCLYFFEHEVQSVEAAQINKIIYLITGQLGTDGERGTPVEAHFRNTIGDFIFYFTFKKWKSSHGGGMVNDE